MILNPFDRKKTSAILATVIASAILIVGASTSNAVVDPQTSNGDIPHIADSAKTLAKHSDKDLLYFLLAGQGPIADENPDLLRAMNFDPNKPHTDEEALDLVIEEYLAYTGSFPRIKQLLVSGEPEKVWEGLERFSNDFVQYLEQSERLEELEVQPLATANGFCGKTVCGAAIAVVLANGLVYANVAVATLALAGGAAVVLTVVVAAYLEEGKVKPNVMSEFERQEITARLTRALA